MAYLHVIITNHKSRIGQSNIRAAIARLTLVHIKNSGICWPSNGAKHLKRAAQPQVSTVRSHPLIPSSIPPHSHIPFSRGLPRVLPVATMGGSSPPFIYDRQPTRFYGPTDHSFNPKAVTQASQIRPPPREKPKGPLVNFNRHPDTVCARTIEPSFILNRSTDNINSGAASRTSQHGLP
jgi:hypothetical protein